MIYIKHLVLCKRAWEQLDISWSQNLKLKASAQKGNYKQSEKTTFRMGENNSKWSNGQRINLKNIQATPAAQFHKNKRPIQKAGQRTKQTFLQRRHTDG